MSFQTGNKQARIKQQEGIEKQRGSTGLTPLPVATSGDRCRGQVCANIHVLQHGAEHGGLGATHRMNQIDIIYGQFLETGFRLDRESQWTVQAISLRRRGFGSISEAGWGESGVLGIDQVFRLTVAFGFLLSM